MMHIKNLKNLKFHHHIYLVLLVIIVASSASCSKKEPTEKTVVVDKEKNIQKLPESMRNFSVASITRGALIFQERCAECHGPQAQGHPGWSPRQNQKQNKKTKIKPMIVAPPLDGSGVAHKRKKAQLVNAITKGIKRGKVLVMPDLKGKLSPQDIEDVITWFQALWPPKVYEAWNRTNQGTLSSKRGS